MLSKLSNLPIRGWRGMSPGGVITAVQKDVRACGVRIGTKCLLRLLCGFRTDRRSWSANVRRLACLLAGRVFRLCSFTATRPLLGAIRLELASRPGEENSRWVLPRAIVARSRESIPNDQLPLQLRLNLKAKPLVVNRINKILVRKFGPDKVVHGYNYELFRQGLTPQTFRYVRIISDKVWICLPRENKSIIYSIGELTKENPKRVIWHTLPPPRKRKKGSRTLIPEYGETSEKDNSEYRGSESDVSDGEFLRRVLARTQGTTVPAGHSSNAFAALGDDSDDDCYY